MSDARPERTIATEQTAVRFLQGEANVAALANREVAVLGYGAQGRANALNLRDSGVRVCVAQRPGGARHEQALADGFEPLALDAAAARSDLILFGTPDERAEEVYERFVAPVARRGATLGFLHGLAIRFELIRPRSDLDVVLVAPKAQGEAVRSEFVAGRGVFALVAVHQDVSGGALRTALGWAAGIGCARAGILETTFADETDTDLFGEQAVLCGGVTRLIVEAFETLVEAGYPQELAYFECCHELRILTDLIHAHGIAGMRDRISSAARFGDVTRGRRVIGPPVRAAMREVLAEIRSGQFARELLGDARQPDHRVRATLAADAAHAIEAVGARLRRLAAHGAGTPGGAVHDRAEDSA